MRSYLFQLVFWFITICLAVGAWAAAITECSFSITDNPAVGLSIIAILCVVYAVVKHPVVRMSCIVIIPCAVVGTLTSLMVLLSFKMGDAHGGFWLGVLFWFLGTIVVAAASAGLLAVAKNLLYALLRLDFLVVLVCAILGVSLFYVGITTFLGALQYHDLCGVMVIIGLIGGAGGIHAPTVSSSMMDINGQQHWIVGGSSNNMIDTDGNRLRERVDGRVEEY